MDHSEPHEQYAKAVERSSERLRIVSRNLLTAQDQERRRIARELHDDYCQNMAAVEIGLRNLRTRATLFEHELDSLISQVSAVCQQLRSLSHSLHPSAVDDLGLEAALAALCEEFETRHNVATRWIASDCDHQSIPPAAATTFYRIAQEAFRNIVKHAGDDVRVTLTLSKIDKEWCLTIHDDGCGFEASAMKHRKGLGLLSMQERLSLIGGRLDIESAPGAGTTLRAWAPQT